MSPTRSSFPWPSVTEVFLGAGYFAVWPAAYAGGAALLIAQLSRQGISGTALLGVASTALAVYLVDRIHPEWWRGEFSASTHPDREQTLQRYLLLALGLLTGSMLLAIWALSSVHPWLSLLPPLGAAATLVYARTGASGHRVKDVLFVKNIVVALGVCSFASSVIATQTVVRGGFASPSDLSALITAGLILLGFVSVDALLCDIPDRGADRIRGTRSAPVVFGTRASWRIAQIATMALSALTIGLGAAGVVRLSVAIVLSAALAGSVFALRHAPTLLLRDLIDMGLALVGLLALASG